MLRFCGYLAMLTIKWWNDLTWNTLITLINAQETLLIQKMANFLHRNVVKIAIHCDLNIGPSRRTVGCR
jgi:hypothetical protein